MDFSLWTGLGDVEPQGLTPGTSREKGIWMQQIVQYLSSGVVDACAASPDRTVCVDRTAAGERERVPMLDCGYTPWLRPITQYVE
jgi:hypothetical protein